MIGLTEKWQKHGIIVGHHKQVDAVQSCAGLQVSERLAQVTVFGTVTYKHLHNKRHKYVSSNQPKHKTWLHISSYECVKTFL